MPDLGAAAFKVILKKLCQPWRLVGALERGMNPKTWAVCLIEPNKFERQILVDLLRNAGVEKFKAVATGEEAIEILELYNANIVITSFEFAAGGDGASWTRGFRRNHKLANRRAAVFVTSSAFSRAMAEECRHAGCNALIGKPISGKVLTATVNKVLTNPRPFIDAPGYVGPCRRAGIVTAGPPSKRRKADAAADAAARLAQAFATLTSALLQMAQGEGGAAEVESGLTLVQAFAIDHNDRPLLTVCATLAQQLSAHDLRSDAGKSALTICADGIAQLAGLALNQSELRQMVALQVCASIETLAQAA
jgi:CheY-like chemotaxis protein